MNTQTLTIEEQERAAYMAGDTRAAVLLGELEDTGRERDALTEELDDTEVFTDELKQELEALRQFFGDCFDTLAAHYPAPSVFSDYDKSVILTLSARAKGSPNEPHRKRIHRSGAQVRTRRRHRQSPRRGPTDPRHVDQ